MSALGVDELHPVRQARHRGEDELHEELVPDARSLDRFGDPRGQLLAAGGGQLVHLLVGAAVLRDVLAADEPVLLKALQRDVDLPYVRRRVSLPEGLLKGELQLIPVRWFLREQRQQRLPHLLASSCGAALFVDYHRRTGVCPAGAGRAAGERPRRVTASASPLTPT